MHVSSCTCVVVFGVFFFVCLHLSPAALDIILIKIKHCSLCVNAVKDQPCLSVAFPSVSPCCLTSFPLLLYLIRDPVLQFGNEACVRRASPAGIRAPHTSETQRGACISILYCFLEPSCLGVHCALAALYLSSLLSNLLSWKAASEVLLYVCVCALTYILFEFIRTLQHKKKHSFKAPRPCLDYLFISACSK